MTLIFKDALLAIFLKLVIPWLRIRIPTKKGKSHDCEYYLWPSSDLVEQADELELRGLVLEEGGHEELAVLQLLLLQL
jgi:hypothetical protein